STRRLAVPRSAMDAWPAGWPSDRRPDEPAAAAAALPVPALVAARRPVQRSCGPGRRAGGRADGPAAGTRLRDARRVAAGLRPVLRDGPDDRRRAVRLVDAHRLGSDERAVADDVRGARAAGGARLRGLRPDGPRSEEPTSELPSREN